MKVPLTLQLFFLVDFDVFQELIFEKKFKNIESGLFLRALKVEVVVTIFSPIVRISPPLGQSIERDVRKGHRASLSCWDV